jgi:hypothetical protein
MAEKSNSCNKSRRPSVRKQKSVAYIHHQSALLSYLVSPQPMKEVRPSLAFTFPA